MLNPKRLCVIYSQTFTIDKYSNMWRYMVYKADIGNIWAEQERKRNKKLCLGCSYDRHKYDM